jgi:hypothetical protein
MAGDWIPMRVDLAEDPAVIAVARTLGIEEETVVGLFHRLWSWANQQTVDGVAAKVDAAWLDRHLRRPGFSAAAADAGWLETKAGALVIPHFDRWNGKSAKARLLATRRQHKKRGEQVSRSERDKNVTRGEERREEKRKKKTSGGTSPPAAEPTPPGPETLATPPDRVSGTACDTSAAGAKTPRQPDPLFDAVAAVTASDPAVNGPRIGRLCKLLRQAKPPYTPDEVYRLRDRQAALLPWVKGSLSLGLLEQHIGLVRAAAADKLNPFREFLSRGKDEPEGDPT